MSRRRFLVTYDITDDRRRTRTFRTLQDFGEHIQFSVFLCDLNDRERIDLRGRLEDIIKQTEDQILTVDLGLADREIDQTISSIGIDFALPSRVSVI